MAIVEAELDFFENFENLIDTSVVEKQKDITEKNTDSLREMRNIYGGIKNLLEDR